MEEKKNKEINENSGSKLTYEQLENAAKQLSEQVNVLYRENAEAKKFIDDLTSNRTYKELELLFKVLKYSDFFTDSFVNRCVTIIMTVMSPSKKETEDSEDTKSNMSNQNED